MCKLAAQSYSQQQCQPGIAARFHFVCDTQLRWSFRIHATGTAGRAFCCGVILFDEEFCITPRWRLTSEKIEQVPASVTLCFACASVIIHALRRYSASVLTTSFLFPLQINARANKGL
jgi:hypothetical protein